jgi:4'-phosphopantetheinyl transferase
MTGPTIYFLTTDAISVDDRAAWLAGAPAHLDADELARMRRFVFPEKQLEFLMARVLVRGVLVAFHDVPPRARIEAPEDGNGKPRLEARPGGPFFNLSHSHGGIAAIVAPDREVAIDVERLRPYNENLVRGTLREAERPRVRGEEEFYRFWTAKEAYMKLVGAGLSIPPRHLEVDLDARIVTHIPSGARHGFAWERRDDFVLSWMAAEPAAAGVRA